MKNSVNVNIQHIYFDFLGCVLNDSDTIRAYWDELVLCYSQPHRFYHDLSHIEYMFAKVGSIKSLIRNWDVLLLAIFYHDIVYDVNRSDNEKRSAEFCVNRFSGSTFLNLDKVESMILASESHQLSEDPDTNCFLDLDIAILGADWETYSKYINNIRKEYSEYTDDAYRDGRLSILKKFLYMKSIFKSDYFIDRLENTARENIQKEMETLSGKSG